MIDDLDPKYRLSYLVGEIVRNDVGVESEMRMVWRKLHDAGLPIGDLQRDFGRLLPQVRKTLEHPEVPVDFKAIASDVLEAASKAHQLRNAFAHDQLLQDYFDEDLVRSMRARTPPRPMTDLQNLADDLLKLTWRTRGVWIIAPPWVGGPLDDFSDRDGLISWTRVAMGHIRDDIPNAIVGTDGESPEPPGGYR